MSGTNNISRFFSKATLALTAAATLILFTACCGAPDSVRKEVHYKEEGEVIESTTPIVE